MAQSTVKIIDYQAVAKYANKIKVELAALNDELYCLLTAADIPFFDSDGKDPMLLLDYAVDSLESAIEILNNK